MVTQGPTPTGRRSSAAAALAELGAHRSDHQRLSVQCPHSHHVAFVYETGAGLVYAARTGPHSHGSKDRIDTDHGARGGREHAELLVANPMADDALPAWCDCGPRSLSRAALLAEIEAGHRKLRLG